MEDTNSRIDLLEVEDVDLIKEGELIWQGDITKVPHLPYLIKKEMPWDKKPPMIPKNHYTKFGEKVLQIIKDKLLEMWILDRTGLYAILKDHSYPRNLDEQGGRAQLTYRLAKDPDELTWAASWLLYKRMGGTLDFQENKEFPVEIETKIPEDYQELQKVLKHQQMMYGTGQITLKRRILELGQEQADMIKWIGINKRLLNAQTSSIKLLNNKINSMAKLDEKTQTFKEGGKSNMADKKTNLPQENWETKASSVRTEKDLYQKIEKLENELKRANKSIKSLQKKEEDKKKKGTARFFYNLRKTKPKVKNRKSPDSNTIEEKSESQEHSSKSQEKSNYSY